MAQSPNKVAHLGEHLAAMREARNFRQFDLATRLKVAPGTLSRQENAAGLTLRRSTLSAMVMALSERSPITDEEMDGICTATGIAPESFREDLSRIDGPGVDQASAACEAALLRLIQVAGPTGALLRLAEAIEAAERGDDGGGPKVLGNNQPKPKQPGGHGSPFFPAGPNGRVPLMPIRQPPTAGGSQNRRNHKAFHRGNLQDRLCKTEGRFGRSHGDSASPLVPHSYRIDGNPLRSNSPRTHNAEGRLGDPSRHRHARRNNGQ